MDERRRPSYDTLIMAGLAALGLLAASLMALGVTERLPHLEDEIAYLFQARTLARGALWAPPAPSEAGFFTPFVLTLDGRRVGKYAIGWPLVLALGEALGAGWLVNPVLGGLLVAAVFVLGRDLFDRQIGILAALLALTSPFFLIQSSTFMSHAGSALWTALLLLGLLRAEEARAAGRPARGWAALMGLATGLLIITRPLTAIAVWIPPALLLLYRAAGRAPGLPALARHYWPVLAAAAPVALLQPLYLYAVTGDPFMNLYTLVWPYDRIGFGPGIGPHSGHTLEQAIANAAADLEVWAGDLFGWSRLSWMPLVAGLIFGLLEARRGRRAWPALLAGVFAALVIAYLTYWVGGSAYGPRYYYEAHAGLAVLAAVGLRGVARFFWHGARTMLPGGDRRTAAHRMLGGSTRLAWPVLGLLIALNLTLYLPGRLPDWRGLYGITREPLDQLARLAAGKPTLVLVRGGLWSDYGAFFSLNSPWYNDPIIAAHDLNLRLSYAVIAMYPGREVWFYADGEFSRQPAPYPEEDTAP